MHKVTNFKKLSYNIQLSYERVFYSVTSNCSMHSQSIFDILTLLTLLIVDALVKLPKDLSFDPLVVQWLKRLLKYRQVLSYEFKPCPLPLSFHSLQTMGLTQYCILNLFTFKVKINKKLKSGCIEQLETQMLWEIKSTGLNFIKKFNQNLKKEKKTTHSNIILPKTRSPFSPMATNTPTTKIITNRVKT